MRLFIIWIKGDIKKCGYVWFSIVFLDCCCFWIRLFRSMFIYYYYIYYYIHKKLYFFRNYTLCHLTALKKDWTRMIGLMTFKNLLTDCNNSRDFCSVCMCVCVCVDCIRCETALSYRTIRFSVFAISWTCVVYVYLSTATASQNKNYLFIRWWMWTKSN